MSILNPNFIYHNAANTNVRTTWERYGFKPTTDADRKAAKQRLADRYQQTQKPILKSATVRKLPPRLRDSASE